MNNKICKTKKRPEPKALGRLKCLIYQSRIFFSLQTWRWKSDDANVLLILGDASNFQSVFPTQSLKLNAVQQFD